MNTIDDTTRRAARLFLGRLAPQFDIVGAILYGSRARGTHRPDSDADVLVLLKGLHGKFVRVKLEMTDVAYDVLLETGVYISPLPVWLDEWEHPDRYSHPELLRNIAREGIELER
ncbi:MAG: nucleotidyltransferase domain-containing protein [Steroidobacteraceae bacterium]